MSEDWYAPESIADRPPEQLHRGAFQYASKTFLRLVSKRIPAPCGLNLSCAVEALRFIILSGGVLKLQRTELENGLKCNSNLFFRESQVSLLAGGYNRFIGCHQFRQTFLFSQVIKPEGNMQRNLSSEKKEICSFDAPVKGIKRRENVKQNRTQRVTKLEP